MDVWRVLSDLRSRLGDTISRAQIENGVFEKSRRRAPEFLRER